MFCDLFLLIAFPVVRRLGNVYYVIIATDFVQILFFPDLFGISTDFEGWNFISSREL